METKNKIKFSFKTVLILIGVVLFSFYLGIFLNSLYVNLASPKKESPVLPLKVNSKKNAQMWLTPEVLTAPLDTKIEISLYLDAKNQVINGFDAVLNYDENVLSLNQVREEASLLFLRKKTENGKIYITAVKSNADQIPFTQIKMATLIFTPKKIGQTAITFDFQKGKTNASTIIKSGTSENILGQIKNGSQINIVK